MPQDNEIDWRVAVGGRKSFATAVEFKKAEYSLATVYHCQRLRANRQNVYEIINTKEREYLRMETLGRKKKCLKTATKMVRRDKKE